MTEKKAKPPRAAKPKARKPKTSSAPGDAAKAHEWLKETQGAAASTNAAEKPAVKNPAAHLAVHQIKPGQVLNPKGRPKGSRNKLGEHFITALQADWEEHGAAAIATVRQERPSDYLKVVASILPKELNVRVDPLEEMDDDELTAILAAARAVSRVHQEAGTREGEEDIRKPTGQLLS